jgi:hypothetical protein
MSLLTYCERTEPARLAAQACRRQYRRSTIMLLKVGEIPRILIVERDEGLRKVLHVQLERERI